MQCFLGSKCDLLVYRFFFGSCAVRKLSKAAAELLRVSRPDQNVPCSSFEAQ